MEATTSFGPVTSHDQVPAALNFLINELGSLKQTIAERGTSYSAPDQWLNLEEFCKYHPAKPAPTTVYGWVSRRAVPHVHDGKNLLFLKSEIDAWLKSKRVKTAYELQEAAEHHSTRQRRGGRKTA